MRVIAGAVIAFVLAAASRASGADTTPPNPASPPPGAPPAPQPPPPAYAYPPPAYAYPPPAYAYPPPAYPPGAYVPGLNPYASANGYNMSMFAYENQRKNVGLALVLEIFVPGVGSIYADHTVGALVTWGIMVGGFSFMIWSLSRELDQRDANGNLRTTHFDETPLLIGLVAILGARVYGLVDAYTSVGRYNRGLAQRLGLPEGVSLGVTPMRGPGTNLAWGPALSLSY